jgi:hypothetical protein
VDSHGTSWDSAEACRDTGAMQISSAAPAGASARGLRFLYIQRASVLVGCLPPLLYATYLPHCLLALFCQVHRIERHGPGFPEVS